MTEPMMRPRVGIVGCGSMGRRQAAAYGMLSESDPSPRLTHLYDQDRVVAHRLATSLSIPQPKVCDSIDALIAAVDVVDIILPTSHHARVAIAAVRAGKHVLVAKPLALTGREAEQIFAAADARGVNVGIAENYRYLSDTIHMLQLGAKIDFVQTTIVHNTGAESADGRRAWYLDPAQSGSYAVFEIGSHEIDITSQLLGDVAAVHAVALDGSADSTHAKAFAITFISPRGAVAQLLLTLSANLPNVRTRLLSVDGCLHYIEADLLDFDDPLAYGIVAMLRDFYTTLSVGGTPPIDVRSGMSTVRIAEAVLESAQSGKLITIGPSA